MSDMGIYKITNTANGKVYIGQSVRLFSRLNDHHNALQNNCHHNQHLQNAYNKYGDIFKFEIITHCDSEEKLDDLERYYIAYYDSTNPKKGYNKEDGGHFNKHPSEETKKKMSDSHKGEKNHMFGKKGKNSPNYGRAHSEEAKKKMSESHKGRTHSEETRKKISEINKGKILSKETKKKISIATKGKNNPMYGKTHSEESRKKISKHISKSMTTTGFYRVYKHKDRQYKQGFRWDYQVRKDNKMRTFSSINLLKLKEKVEAQNLPWEIIDKEKAKKSLELNNKYHKGEKND